MVTQEMFDQEMHNAVVENGYEEMRDWNARRIAQDIMDCCSDFEGADYETVRQMAENWLKRHGN